MSFKIGKIDVGGAFDKAKHKVQDTGNNIKDEIKKEVFDELKEPINAVLGDVVNRVEQTAQHASREVIDLIGKEVLKKGLDASYWLAMEAKESIDKMDESKRDLINQLGIFFSLSVIKLRFVNFSDRISEIIGNLDKARNGNLKCDRKTLMGLVEALGPTSVEITAEARFALGVSSSLFSGSFGLESIPTELFILMGDGLLKKAGVP